MSYQIRSDLGRAVIASFPGWVLAAGLVACVAPAPEPHQGEPPHSTPEVLDGATVWRNQCASCHGDLGDGGVAPALTAWARDRVTLLRIIDETMPLGTAQTCQGPCAEAVADYVLDDLQKPPVDCLQPHFPKRQLRLLTRAEYQNTVEDLLQVMAPAPVTCTQLSQCNWQAESCVSGHCVTDACGLHTFSFDAGAETLNSVVVAGDFNNWAASPQDGAWPMRFDAALGRWVLKQELTPGRHSYKLVLNGDRWVPDPSSAQSEPDGFGGQNSVMTIECGSETPEPLQLNTLTADFPVQSRPSGYPYDNGAEAGLVSSVHLGEYMMAAQRIADHLLAQPQARLGCALSDRACVQAQVLALAARAFRRELLPDEQARLQALLAAQSDISAGARIAIRVIFASPSFLYRSELGIAQEDGTYRLQDHEIASAMSYLFLGSQPDSALKLAAAEGRLQTPQGRRSEAERLLQDPRAKSVVADFAVQWLGADRILGKDKHPGTYPGFDSALRQDALNETRALVEHVVFEGSGKLEELYQADYSFLNQGLAELYGLHASGTALQKVAYGDAPRSGVLAHASVLATYAHSDQSSPILRGLFVRQRLLCQKFGRPPANAGGVPDVDPEATTRERFRQHTDDPVCSSCHQYIDDLGFGFERFDAVGAYRETENGQPVDGIGNLNDVEGFGQGTQGPFASLAELADILAASRSAKACFVTQYWRFAYGYLEQPEDQCGLSGLLQDFEGGGHDVQSLMLALVQSPSFVTRQ